MYEILASAAGKKSHWRAVFVFIHTKDVFCFFFNDMRSNVILVNRCIMKFLAIKK